MTHDYKFERCFLIILGAPKRSKNKAGKSHDNSLEDGKIFKYFEFRLPFV